MDLTHRFTVPTSVEETWAHFNDIGSVAECFPGATVESVEEDTFTGQVKVKLGPISLLYKGSGTFVDKDEAARTFKVEAKGKDKRGNGTAAADVLLSMTEGSGGATDVEVITALAITGKPAQFGRGVVQDVSDKLLGQFVECLEQRLSGRTEPEMPPVSEPGPDEGTPIGTAASAAARSAAPPPPAPTVAANGSSARTPGPTPDDQAIDLGATVLPVLARTYWKQGLAGLGVVALLVAWWRRR